MEGNLKKKYKMKHLLPIVLDGDKVVPEFPMSLAPKEPFFSQLVWDRTDQEDVQHAILPC